MTDHAPPPPSLSRRVDGIAFSDPVWLRLGVINRLGYDRRAQMPWYVEYRFAAVFAESDLCWRGDVLWERGDGSFEPVRHADRACRTVAASDTGRRIFGIAIRHDSLAASGGRAHGGLACGLAARP